MASAPVYYATPRNAVVAISTANTNRDGTGTIGTIFTAGASGSKVERIIVQATGTTTAGVVRLYVNNNSTSFLYDELLVSAITPSATVAAYRAERDCSLPGGLLLLPTNYSIRASTHNAESFNIIIIGGDL